MYERFQVSVVVDGIIKAAALIIASKTKLLVRIADKSLHCFDKFQRLPDEKKL